MNGGRNAGSHPSLPVTSDELAEAATSCVAAGAAAIHMHPRDSSGRESLDPAVVAQAVQRVRAVVGGVPIGVSTGAWIEPNPKRRATEISRWPGPGNGPDMASVNLSEDGAPAVMRALLTQGIDVEAGVWSVADVHRLVDTGLHDRIVRVLVEIVDSVEDPLAEAWAIDDALGRVGVDTPRLHHGENGATWPVLRQAKQLGRDIRIGLEDTLSLPDGSPAPSNHALVHAALTIA